MTARTKLSPAECERIRHLRYVRKLPSPHVAAIVGRSESCVRSIAPGTPRNVDNGPLRLAVEQSATPLSEVARQLGWFWNDRPDVTRLQRALGQKPTTMNRGRRTTWQTIRSDYAAVIAEAIGLAPHEVAA